MATPYSVTELPVEEINIKSPEAYRAKAIDDAVRQGKRPPGVAKNPARTPVLDRVSAKMQAQTAPKPASITSSLGGNVRAALNGKIGKGVGLLAAGGAVANAMEPDSTARYAQRFATTEPTGDGTLGDIAKFAALRAGGFATDVANNATFGLAGKLYRDNQNPQPIPSIAQAAPQPAAVPAQTKQQAQVTTAPKASDGSMNQQTKNRTVAPQQTIDNGAILAEQAQMTANRFNQNQGNGGYQDPAYAQEFYKNQVASEFTPGTVKAVNEFIRNRNDSQANVASVNNRFAAQGMGDIAKSVDASGNVSYGNAATPVNPQAIAARKAAEAANFAEGTARAEKDKQLLASMEQARAIREIGDPKVAAAALIEQSKIGAATDASKAKLGIEQSIANSNMAVDKETIAGKQAERKQAERIASLQNQYLGLDDTNDPGGKKRTELAGKMNALTGNTAKDKFIPIMGKDDLGNPIFMGALNSATGEMSQPGAAKTSRAEYDSLPVGATYTGPDGKQYTKGK